MKPVRRTKTAVSPNPGQAIFQKRFRNEMISVIFAPYLHQPKPLSMPILRTANLIRFAIPLSFAALLSCGNPFGGSSEGSGLDRAYTPTTAVEDLREMTTSGALDSVQSGLLRNYMIQKGLIASESVNATTSYRELLTKALNANADGSDPAAQGKTGEAARAALVDLVILADSVGTAGHMLIVNISVDNVSGKTISGLRGHIALYDVFNDRLQSTSYRLLYPLGPGQRHQKVFKIQLEQTAGVLDYSGGVPIRVVWEPEEVLLK